MRLSTWAGTAAAVTLLAGCATTAPPQTELARADVAIEQAMAGEAGQYAPAELRLAQDKLKNAREAGSTGDRARAEQLAEEALISARLALAEAESRRIEQMVSENLRAVRAQQQQARGGSTR